MDWFHPKQLYKAQQGKCFLCGKVMDEFSHHAKHNPKGWTREHFYPKSKLKFSPKYNIVLSHYYCNQKKGNKLPTRAEIVRFKEITIEAFL